MGFFNLSNAEINCIISALEYRLSFDSGKIDSYDREQTENILKSFTFIIKTQQ